jgi:hypothetical protein
MMNYRLHPHCVVTPNNVTIILYYITRVLNMPVFLNTELGIFCTPRWWQWIRDSNLPPSIAMLMHGTLKEEYGLKMEGCGSTVSISLDDESALLMEQWLKGWKDQCPRRSYSQHSRVFSVFTFS